VIVVNSMGYASPENAIFSYAAPEISRVFPDSVMEFEALSSQLNATLEPVTNSSGTIVGESRDNIGEPYYHFDRSLYSGVLMSFRIIGNGFGWSSFDVQSASVGGNKCGRMYYVS